MILPLPINSGANLTCVKRCSHACTGIATEKVWEQNNAKLQGSTAWVAPDTFLMTYSYRWWLKAILNIGMGNSEKDASRWGLELYLWGKTIHWLNAKRVDPVEAFIFSLRRLACRSLVSAACCMACATCAYALRCMY